MWYPISRDGSRKGLESFGFSNVFMFLLERLVFLKGRVPLYSSEHVAGPEPLRPIEETALSPDSD